MSTPVNDYEVMFGKELLNSVTMLQIGAPGADSLREVAAIMKVIISNLLEDLQGECDIFSPFTFHSGSYVTEV